MATSDFHRWRAKTILVKTGQLTQARKAALDAMSENDLKRVQDLVRPYVVSLVDLTFREGTSPLLAHEAATLFHDNDPGTTQENGQLN